MLFASLGCTNMHGGRSLQLTLRSQEVKMSTIEIHRSLDIWVDFSPANVNNNNYSIRMWSAQTPYVTTTFLF